MATLLATGFAPFSTVVSLPSICPIIIDAAGLEMQTPANVHCDRSVTRVRASSGLALKAGAERVSIVDGATGEVL
jgi:hypothetical protein